MTSDDRENPNEQAHEEQGEGTPAARVLALRKALGLTQEAFAQRCPGLTRVEMNQIEAGKNKATSYATRHSLAVGADVPVEALAAYLDMEVRLAELLRLRGTYASTQWWRAMLAQGADPTPVEGSRIRRK